VRDHRGAEQYRFGIKRAQNLVNFSINTLRERERVRAREKREEGEIHADLRQIDMEFRTRFSAGHLPRCQIGLLAGLLSTSHFRLTDIPSTIGIPKPGKRVIANDGVSETGIKQLVSVPSTSMRAGICVSMFSRSAEKSSRDVI